MYIRAISISVQYIRLDSQPRPQARALVLAKSMVPFASGNKTYMEYMGEIAIVHQRYRLRRQLQDYQHDQQRGLSCGIDSEAIQPICCAYSLHASSIAASGASSSTC